MKKKTMYSVICRMFESDKRYTLVEIYQTVLENGIEDKGGITRHSVRGAIHRLNKKGIIERISPSTYVKSPDMQQE